MKIIVEKETQKKTKTETNKGVMQAMVKRVRAK